MADVLQCPVCGRLPKIKCKEPWGAYLVHITCKSLFGKVHEQALVYGVWRNDAYREAIDLWNARVRNYKEVNNNANANN